MQSKIRRKPVAMRPSRIRREPVRVPTEAELKAAEVSKREREKWRTAAGVLFFAAGIAALAVAISAATYSRYDAAAVAREAARFRQCYSATGVNCVLDGDTIRVQGQWLDIAGLDAPEIKGAACGEERDRGIDAAVRLENLLNSGQVGVSAPVRDQYGRVVRKVEVNGKDVARAMISARVARVYDGETRSVCGKAAQPS
jgi:endonuclease YncB( thermonuclease family)